MARTSVLMCTEGTYPHSQGGVSVWCDQLVRGLPEFEFKIFAVTDSPHAKPVFHLPLNVTETRSVALWGTQELGGQETTFAEIYRRKSRTSSNVIREEFLESFHEAADCVVTAGRCPEKFATALLNLHLYFKDFDFAKTMTSPEAWDVFLRVCERSFPGGRELTIHDATVCLRWMQRFLGILAVPLPRADITHGSMSGLSSVPGVLNKLLTGAPFLLTEHGIYMRELYMSLMRVGQSDACRRFLLAFNETIVAMNYHYADLVTTLGNFNKSWQIEFGASESKIRITPNGADHERFQAPSRPRRDRPVILTLARIYRLKGIEFLLRAAAIVGSRFSPVLFRIFGEVADQEYFDECRTFIAENGLEDLIEFGNTGNPAAALRDADVFCLPSISEGMPYCILEAMFSGLPVVATDVGNIGEMLDGTGIVVPPTDPDSLAKAILSLLEDPEAAHNRRLSLGEAGQRRAQSLYTTKQAVGRFREIYQSLLYERAIPKVHTATPIGESGVGATA
jgi:polysaccharide biosynthesis protein PelF